jgi:hypothetical protein
MNYNAVPAKVAPDEVIFGPQRHSVQQGLCIIFELRSLLSETPLRTKNIRNTIKK